MLVLFCGGTAWPVMAGEETKRRTDKKGKKVTVKGEVLNMISKT